MRIALLTVTLTTVALAACPATPAHAQTTGSSVDGYSEPGGSIVSEVGPRAPGVRAVGPDRSAIDAGAGDRASGGPSGREVLSELDSGTAATPPSGGGVAPGSAGGGAPLGTGVSPPAQPGGAATGDGTASDDASSGGGGGGGRDSGRDSGDDRFGDGTRNASVGGGQRSGPGEVSPGSLGFGIGATDVALVLVASCMLLLIGVGLGSLARLERTL